MASLALGLVLSFRASGVVNFAHAAMGVYVAFASYEFRESGDVVLPFLGLPARFHLLGTPTLAAQLAFTVLLAAGLGLVVFGLVFRPLRRAPALARVVASLGLMLYLQETVRLRFPTAGATLTTRRPVLPDDTVRIAGTAVTQNRLLLAGLSLLVTAALWALFRFTRFGLTTRAAAGNEKGALLLGLSPDRVAAICWMISSVLAGFAVLLIEPIAGLDVTTTSLLVVPALAAALLGALSSFSVTTAAGLGIGMVQSLILGYVVRPDTNWIPDWLPETGLQQAVPVVVILAALVWRGDVLPTRAALAQRSLPASPTPRHDLLWVAVLGGGAAVGLLTFGPAYRQALIVSLVAVLLSLSVVVVTGYVGQISLAALAFAGIAGFAVIDLAREGVPFPVATVLAALVATAVGLLVGLPAARVRGMSLAVATLAMAVALEQLVLASPPFSGGPAGRSAPRPSLFGLDVGVSARGDENFRPAYGFTVLAVVIVACLAVANLRRNRTGLRWLAVRANERAAAAAGIDVRRAKLGAFAVSSCLAGLAGVFTAYGTSRLSTTSFMVIGALVVLSLTYLAGISSVSGALLAAGLSSAGLITTALDDWSGGGTGDYVFATSGLMLIVTAIVLPDGITGAARAVGARAAAGLAVRPPAARRVTATEPEPGPV